MCCPNPHSWLLSALYYFHFASVYMSACSLSPYYSSSRSIIHHYITDDLVSFVQLDLGQVAVIVEFLAFGLLIFNPSCDNYASPTSADTEGPQHKQVYKAPKTPFTNLPFPRESDVNHFEHRIEVASYRSSLAFTRVVVQVGGSGFCGFCGFWDLECGVTTTMAAARRGTSQRIEATRIVKKVPIIVVKIISSHDLSVKEHILFISILLLGLQNHQFCSK